MVPSDSSCALVGAICAGFILMMARSCGAGCPTEKEKAKLKWVVSPASPSEMCVSPVGWHVNVIDCWPKRGLSEGAHVTLGGDANPAGVVVATDDREGFLAAAEKLLSDESLRCFHGENARRYAEWAFDIERIAGRFETVLSRAVQA